MSEELKTYGQLAATWRERYREYSDAAKANDSLDDDSRAQRAIGVAYKRCAEQLEAALAAAPASSTTGDATPVTIHGASDDLVEVSGVAGADEFSAGRDDSWQADLISPDGGQMRVYVRYERNGCWSAAVSQVAEDVPLPDWTTVITQAPAINGPGYSALLAIDAPAGTKLVTQDGAE